MTTNWWTASPVHVFCCVRLFDSCVSILYDQSQLRPDPKSCLEWKVMPFPSILACRSSRLLLQETLATNVNKQLMNIQQCIRWEGGGRLTGTYQSFYSHVLLSIADARHHAGHVCLVGSIRGVLLIFKCANTWFFMIFWHPGLGMSLWWPQMCSKSVKNSFFISCRL